MVVFPFTPETKADPYEHTPVLKDSLLHLGIWDREFTAAQLVEQMDAAGVEKVMLCAQAGGSWEVSYDYVRQMMNEASDRILGTAGIDPRDIAAGVRKLEQAVREWGFVGAHSYPHWFRLSPADRVYYPFYWRCIELDVPVQIQVGMAYQAGLRNVGHPSEIDTIAVDLPELRMVCIHTGYPWEREMIAVAWKHPNVFIGADLLHPRDWSPELLAFIRGEGREKTMWGTNKPVLEFQDSLDGVDALGLDADTKELLLHGNVRRVYRLPH